MEATLSAPPSLLQVATGSASRNELAHRRHGKAHERVVSLGEQLSSAFEELYASGQELRDEHGIEVNATLDFPLREAWFDWKAKRLLKDIDGRSR